MKELVSYLEFIQETELLKGVLRTAWQSSGRQESTAEHSWRLALLASVMLAEFPELDQSRVLIMCLIHDLGEIYEGDISAALLPDPGIKLGEESRAVRKVFSLLPPEAEKRYLEIWQEYVTASTKEALFVKALDKAETIIQHNQGKNPPDFDYQFNLAYGEEYFRDDEILIELRKKLDLETRKRGNIKEEGIGH